MFPKPGKKKKQGRFKGGIEKKAWNEFSFYSKILRSSKDGVISCCTCGKKFLWAGSNSKVHAGHCYSWAQYPQMRFEILNVWPQCYICNNPMNDVTGKFAVFIAKNLTPNELLKLEWLSMPKHKKNHSKEELQVIYEEYKALNEKLKSEVDF